MALSFGAYPHGYRDLLLDGNESKVLFVISTRLVALFGFPNTNERFQMFISVGDLFAIAIALGTATALVITSAVRNAQLTKSRDAYRTAYLSLKAGK